MKLLNALSILTFVVVLFSCTQSEKETDKKVDLTEEVDTSIEEEAEVTAEDENESQPTDIDMEEFTKDLPWIEKFFVKDDPLRLYSLLKYKEDDRYIQIYETLRSQGELFPETIVELDNKNGFIKFFQPSTDCHTTLVYWNQSNGAKLIGKGINCCTMFCEGDIYFEVYDEDSGYTKLDVNHVIPEYKKLRSTMPDGHSIEDGGYDNSIELPRKGMDIQFCIEGDCKVLIWNDGKFILKESKVKVEEVENAPDPIDPREDPDYIGTPCKYVDGECIRHNHKK